MTVVVWVIVVLGCLGLAASIWIGEMSSSTSSSVGDDLPDTEA